MHKHFLASSKVLTKAFLIASLSATSMSVIPTYAAISMDSDDKAALVEQRLAHINTQYDILLERLTVIPDILDVSLEYSELEHDAANQSATSVGELVLEVDEDELNIDEIVFTIDKSIDYNDALNQEDILARVTTGISFKEDSRAYRELVPDQREIMSAYLQKIVMRTDLLADSTFKQYVTIPAINSAGHEEEVELDFGGLDIEGYYDENNFVEGFGDVHIDIKQLIFSEVREVIDYKALMELSQQEQDNLAYDDYPMSTEMVEELNVQPFSIDYSISEKGDIKLDSSPIAISVDDNNYALLIERLAGVGKVTYDQDIQQYLGGQGYSAHNVVIETIDLPAPIAFESIEYMQNLERSGDKYNWEGQFLVMPEESTFSLLTDGMFVVNALDFQFELTNFSKEVFEQLSSLDSLAASEDLDINDDNRELVSSLIKSLSNDGANAGMDFTLSTDEGDAYMLSTLHLREGTDAQAWTDAIANEDSASLETLVNKDLLFDVEVAVSISLLDAVGMTDMAQMMGNPYILQENGYFVIRVTNEGDGPLINGQSLEAIEAGM